MFARTELIATDIPSTWFEGDSTKRKNNVANHHVWSTYLPKGDVSATPNHHLCLETNLLFILALMPARLI